MNAPTLSTESLFTKIRSSLCLAALVGDTKPMEAFKLAGDVWEQFPAMFPDFAANLADEPLNPRPICWALSEEVKNVPGAYDVYKRALEIARA